MGKYCAKYSKQQSCIWDFVVKFQRLLLYFFIDIKALMNKVQLILRIKVNFCLVKKP